MTPLSFSFVKVETMLPEGSLTITGEDVYVWSKIIT